MTPGARIQAVIELCEKIEASSVPPDGVIAAYFRKRRYAGSKDRRQVIDHVYTMFRRRDRLDWRVREAGVKSSVRTRVLADLALGGDVEIDALFTGDRYHPPPVGAGERVLFDLEQPLNQPSMPDCTALEYPEWLDGRLRDAFGDALEAEMTALNLPAPLHVRVNTLKGTREQAIQSLADEGIKAEPTKYSPLGLKIFGRVRLDAVDAFRKGLIEVQDEGSQLIALLTGAKKGMAVADICAGAGGKTLALAAAMQGGLGLVACDVSERRMAAMNKRLLRAGVAKIDRHAFATGEDDPWVEENSQRFDRVLADAPCTGSGAWRRDVTAKWRLTTGELRNATIQQRKVLEKASRLVKGGGRLIYATCSVLKPENEDQIQWFLEGHQDFKSISANEVWQQTIGGAGPSTGAFLRLSPASTDTDGFFVAVLEKSL